MNTSVRRFRTTATAQWHESTKSAGALSAPLHSLFWPRSEGATEPGSGRPALGQSSLCLGVFVVNVFSVSPW